MIDVLILLESSALYKSFTYWLTDWLTYLLTYWCQLFVINRNLTNTVFVIKNCSDWFIWLSNLKTVDSLLMMMMMMMVMRLLFRTWHPCTTKTGTNTCTTLYIVLNMNNVSCPIFYLFKHQQRYLSNMAIFYLFNSHRRSLLRMLHCHSHVTHTCRPNNFSVKS